MKYVLKFLLSSFAIMFIAMSAARAQGVEGKWLNEEKTAKVQVYLAKDGKYYGKIVWLKEPNGPDGKPRVDGKNPNKSKRTVPLMDLLMLRGFTKKSATSFEGGTIYDPKNGKTYDCKMTLDGNTLNIRGYIGVSMIGRTTKWTRSN